MLFHIDHNTRPYGFLYNMKWISAVVTALLLAPILIPVIAIQSKTAGESKPKYIVAVNTFYTSPPP
jgi:hypothetical protein